jgi:hypothetical protein
MDVQQEAEQEAAMRSSKTTTLLELVWALSHSGASEHIVVATITGLINSGQVRLCGTFAGARIEETVPCDAASPTLPTPRTRRKRDV